MRSLLRGVSCKESIARTVWCWMVALFLAPPAPLLLLLTVWCWLCSCTPGSSLATACSLVLADCSCSCTPGSSLATACCLVLASRGVSRSRLQESCCDESRQEESLMRSLLQGVSHYTNKLTWELTYVGTQ